MSIKKRCQNDTIAVFMSMYLDTLTVYLLCWVIEEKNTLILYGLVYPSHKNQPIDLACKQVTGCYMKGALTVNRLIFLIMTS